VREDKAPPEKAEGNAVMYEVAAVAAKMVRAEITVVVNRLFSLGFGFQGGLSLAHTTLVVVSVGVLMAVAEIVAVQSFSCRSLLFHQGFSIGIIYLK
jgi:hypothetical protein